MKFPHRRLLSILAVALLILVSGPASSQSRRGSVISHGGTDIKPWTTTHGGSITSYRRDITPWTTTHGGNIKSTLRPPTVKAKTR